MRLVIGKVQRMLPSFGPLNLENLKKSSEVKLFHQNLNLLLLETFSLKSRLRLLQLETPSSTLRKMLTKKTRVPFPKFRKRRFQFQARPLQRHQKLRKSLRRILE